MKVDIGFWDKDGEYIESIEELTMEEEKEITKEIIIDGVNVKKCEFYEFDDVLDCLCYEYIDVDGASPAYHCKDRPDCYYKQLQQAKAENERLKEEIKSINRPIYLPNIEQKVTNKYRKALEEIREMCSNTCEKNKDCIHSCYECKSIDEPVAINRILNKISEVLDERN